MELPDNVLALYSAEIELRDGRPMVAVPEHEIDVGSVEIGDRCRIAILPPSGAERATENDARNRARGGGDPPVEEGETREVEIEDVGDQGDGIARIGPGYVVFVPETNVGDRVTVQITEARENFAFADVLEDEPISG